jgi:hypothetical protein
VTIKKICSYLPLTNYSLGSARSFTTTKGSDLFLVNGTKLDFKKLTVLPNAFCKKPILHYSAFFNTEELSKIREIASNLTLSPAKVNVAAKSGERVEKFKPEYRNNFVAHLPIDDKSQKEINQRLLSLEVLQKTHTVIAGNFQGNFKITGVPPMLKILSYRPPEKRNNHIPETMIKHRDYPELLAKKPFTITMYTLLVCLNKAIKGGGLHIYPDEAPKEKVFIDLEEGNAMLFASNPESLLHKPEPVIQGERIILRGLILGEQI